MKTRLKIRAEELREELVAIRRTIHAHPEYGFQEFKTARLISGTLEKLGARVREGVAKTGVIGELGHGNPVVAIRADMDALPIAEDTGLPFASIVPNMMHACGHDAHVTCALGAAMLLAKDFQEGSSAGTVRFLFQPSEEQRDEDGHSGAIRLIEEGALDGVEQSSHYTREVCPLAVWELRVGRQWLQTTPLRSPSRVGPLMARIRRKVSTRSRSQLR